MVSTSQVKPLQNHMAESHSAGKDSIAIRKDLDISVVSLIGVASVQYRNPPPTDLGMCIPRCPEISQVHARNHTTGELSLMGKPYLRAWFMAVYQPVCISINVSTVNLINQDKHIKRHHMDPYCSENYSYHLGVPHGQGRTAAWIMDTRH